VHRAHQEDEAQRRKVASLLIQSYDGKVPVQILDQARAEFVGPKPRRDEETQPLLPSTGAQFGNGSIEPVGMSMASNQSESDPMVSDHLHHRTSPSTPLTKQATEKAVPKDRNASSPNTYAAQRGQAVPPAVEEPSGYLASPAATVGGR